MLYKQKSFDFVAWIVGNNSIVDLTRLFAGKWMALGSQSSNPLQPLTVSFVITRPKPTAYGWQRLGWAGQDSVWEGKSWGFLNVSFRASDAHLGLAQKCDSQGVPTFFSISAGQ